MDFRSVTVPMDDSTAVHVRIHDGESPAIILLHDLDCSSAYWDPVMRRLLDMDPDLHLLAVDLRGHGASRGSGETSRKRLVSDLRRLCKHLSIDAPVVCGHGWGADIALAADNVGSAIAINPSFGRDAAPFPEDFPRPADLPGAHDEGILTACRVGVTSAKRLRRSRREPPLLLVVADPLDTSSDWYPELADAALEHFAWQDASRHLPLEMPSAVAALVLAWIEEVA